MAKRKPKKKLKVEWTKRCDTCANSGNCFYSNENVISCLSYVKKKEK